MQIKSNRCYGLWKKKNNESVMMGIAHINVNLLQQDIFNNYNAWLFMCHAYYHFQIIWDIFKYYFILWHGKDKSEAPYIWALPRFFPWGFYFQNLQGMHYSDYTVFWLSSNFFPISILVSSHTDHKTKLPNVCHLPIIQS